MDNKQQRSIQSYRRMLDWKQSRDGVLQAAPAPVQAHFTALGVAVTQIETNAVTQVSQHQLSTRPATDADLRREAVREAMRPITKTARALQGTVFGISTISRMPDTHWDNDKLVGAATLMAENAATFQAALVEHGLSSDSIEVLKTATTALKSSVDARGAAKFAAAGAKKGVDEGFKAAKKLVSLLDSSLTQFLKSDPATLASWRSAKRVTVKGVVGTIVPPAPATTAPSTTLPATAAASATHAA
jgi:hypothetical protein